MEKAALKMENWNLEFGYRNLKVRAVEKKSNPVLPWWAWKNY